MDPFVFIKCFIEDKPLTHSCYSIPTQFSSILAIYMQIYLALSLNFEFWFWLEGKRMKEKLPPPPHSHPPPPGKNPAHVTDCFFGRCRRIPRRPASRTQKKKTMTMMWQLRRYLSLQASIEVKKVHTSHSSKIAKHKSQPRICSACSLPFLIFWVSFLPKTFPSALDRL